MDDSERNSLVLKIVRLLESDNVSNDEHDPKILEKYYNFASNELGTENLNAKEIVNEAFLYLKMQNTTDIDPVKEGDRFAAGFS
jgi:hypothetical protein